MNRIKQSFVKEKRLLFFSEIPKPIVIEKKPEKKTLDSVAASRAKLDALNEEKREKFAKDLKKRAEAMEEISQDIIMGSDNQTNGYVDLAKEASKEAKTALKVGEIYSSEISFSDDDLAKLAKADAAIKKFEQDVNPDQQGINVELEQGQVALNKGVQAEEDYSYVKNNEDVKKLITSFDSVGNKTLKDYLTANMVEAIDERISPVMKEAFDLVEQINGAVDQESTNAEIRTLVMRAKDLLSKAHLEIKTLQSQVEGVSEQINSGLSLFDQFGAGTEVNALKEKMFKVFFEEQSGILDDIAKYNQLPEAIKSLFETYKPQLVVAFIVDNSSNTDIAKVTTLLRKAQDPKAKLTEEEQRFLAEIKAYPPIVKMLKAVSVDLSTIDFSVTTGDLHAAINDQGQITDSAKKTELQNLLTAKKDYQNSQGNWQANNLAFAQAMGWTQFTSGNDEALKEEIKKVQKKLGFTDEAGADGLIGRNTLDRLAAANEIKPDANA